MAIAPTGNIFKGFEFDGQSSKEYGVYITGAAVFNAPEREVEMISIPGRNGSFALDKGRFENIEVTYPAGVFAYNEADFAQAVSDLRNYLCSRHGYCRLVDEYNPTEYRLAIYKSGLEVDPAQLIAGEFSITFDCKPQRYLLSGEEPITIGEWGDTETASGTIAEFEAVEGDGVKSLVADIEPIQDLHGYDKPWAGGAGKNKLENIASTSTSNGITFTVNSDGTIKVSGTATATTYKSINNNLILADGNYTLSGVASSNSYYMYINAKKVGGGTTSGFANTISKFNFTADSTLYTAYDVGIGVENGTTINTTFYPMIRLSSVSDATWQPYSNVCPISGRTSVVANISGKNLLDIDSVEIGTAWNGNANSARARLVIELNQGQTYTLKQNGDSDLDSWYGILTDTIPASSAGTMLSNPWTFIATSKYLSLGFNKTAISKADIEALKLQLELGTTATAYESYNGNTYTTNLGRTVYGGTLDVVSGELTVDRAFITLDGSSDEVYTDVSTSTVHSIVYTPTDAPKTYPIAAIPPYDISNYLQPRSKSIIISNAQGFTHYSEGLRINIVSLTTVDEYRAYFVSNPLQIVYELETPQTVQLTAQEVELLVGLNQIWANSGDVTVEYGTAPNVVINPTLFEARPMLEVEGYGTIGFNGYEIELADTTLGEIVLASAPAMPLRVLTFDKNKVANGDPIFFSGDSTFPFYASYMVKKESSVSSVSITTLSQTNVVAQEYDLTERTKVVNLILDVSAGFVAGTPSSITGAWSGTLSYVVSGTTYTTTLSATLSIEFDGDHTFYFNISDLLGIPQTYFSGGTADNGKVEISAISSVGSLGHPTYIDCDLGEAYMIKDNVPISLDAYIDLGSDLPCLAVGANEFTYDNTVTDLKVIPRWWKV